MNARRRCVNGRGRWARARLALLASAAAAAVLAGSTLPAGWGTAAGQVVAVADASDPAQQKHDGFSIRKEAAKFNDALEDFARYRDKKAWELAFRSLETLAEAKRDGMVPAGNGFFVPSRQRVLASLTSLPPEGKQAFRLFYDAKARQLLERAESASKAAGAEGTSATAAASPLPVSTPSSSSAAKSPAQPADEIAALREIFEKYFISSVGDRAADRLGDALFESGDFAGAATAWGAVLKDYPETTLPKLRLHVKRCTALARAGQLDRLDDAMRQVRTEFAGERVKVGGREVVATDLLEEIRRSAATPATPATPATRSTTRPTTGPTTNPTTAPVVEEPISAPTGPVRLPTEDKPVWQVRMLDDKLAKQFEQALTSNNWAAQFSNLRNASPSSVCDGRRVYVNWLGIVFAADVKTGKMLWRNRKFAELGDKFQYFVSSMADADSYSISGAHGRLFVTGINLDRLNNYQEPVRLVAMNAADGKVKWSSSSGSLANWSFLGGATPAGDVVYAAARQRNQNDVSLLCIGAEKGELQWQVLLGTAQGGQNPYRGDTVVPSPTVLTTGGTVYVLTNNGALLAVDPVARRLDWAFTFEPPPMMGQQRFWSGQAAPPELKMPAAAFVEGSTMFLKEENADACYAIDLAGPSLLWKRPLDRGSSVMPLDGNRVLFVGEDVEAIDVKDAARAMRWSTPLPNVTSKLSPIVAGDRLLVMAPRGIYEINLANGDPSRIFRGADRDSNGGTLRRAPGRLISISNAAVTAYPVPDDARPPASADNRR